MELYCYPEIKTLIQCCVYLTCTFSFLNARRREHYITAAAASLLCANFFRVEFIERNIVILHGGGEKGVAKIVHKGSRRQNFFQTCLELISPL